MARRKLNILHAATKLDDLKVPPGNRLHKLEANRAGQHAIRINDQLAPTPRPSRIFHHFDVGRETQVALLCGRRAGKVRACGGPRDGEGVVRPSAWTPLEAEEDDGVPRNVLHDLRRIGVRNLVRSGVPQSVAMAISGHKTASVFRRCDVGGEQDIRDTAEKLSRYHDAQNVGAVSGPFSEEAPAASKLVN